MGTPENNDAIIEIPDFVGEQLKSELNDFLPSSINDFKQRVLDTIDGYVKDGFSNISIREGLLSDNEVQENMFKVFEAIEKVVGEMKSDGLSKENIEVEMMTMGEEQFISYILQRKSEGVDYKKNHIETYGHYISALESLKKYSSNPDIREGDISSNIIPIEHGVKLVTNAIHEYKDINLTKILLAIFFTLCSSMKTSELTSALTSSEQEESFSQLRVFFVLGKILEHQTTYVHEDIIQSIIIANYFGLDTKINYMFRDYVGSLLEKKLFKVEECKRKILGYVCLKHLKLFKGTEKIHFAKLFEYLKENYESKKDGIDNFFNNCDFLYKLTEEEILFVLKNDLESSNICRGKESIQICKRLVGRGFGVDEIMNLETEQLQYIDTNNQTSNSELLTLTVENKGNFENIKKIKKEIETLESDMEYLPINHSSRKSLLALIESINEETQAHNIKDEIEKIDKEFHQGEIIRLHKHLTNGDVKGMRLINFVYEKYPKTKKSDRRAYKEELKKTLGVIFNKDLRKQGIISQVIEKYGAEIVGLGVEIKTLQEFLVEFVGENINNIEFVLLSEGEMNLKDFTKRAQDTSAIEESIEKSIQESFEERADVLIEAYTVSSTEMPLLIKIGNILNNAEKNNFITYCEELFCTNTPQLNQEQLTSTYRILNFMYSDFGIRNNSQAILNLVGNGGVESEEISDRINMLYKVIGKTINKSQVTNQNDFSHIVISYLQSGDIEILNNLQLHLSSNTITASNKYDENIF